MKNNGEFSLSRFKFFLELTPPLERLSDFATLREEMIQLTELCPENLWSQMDADQVERAKKAEAIDINSIDAFLEWSMEWKGIFFEIIQGKEGVQKDTYPH